MSTVSSWRLIRSATWQLAPESKMQQNIYILKSLSVRNVAATVYMYNISKKAKKKKMVS